MPRDSAGNYTLPPNAILGCSPGQALTSDWQNTTFADIYNGFNQGTINTNITALLLMLTIKLLGQRILPVLMVI